MSHEHLDVGGGYCECGAERCSLPECDSWCVHLNEWVERTELAEMRRPSDELFRRVALT